MAAVVTMRSGDKGAVLEAEEIRRWMSFYPKKRGLHEYWE